MKRLLAALLSIAMVLSLTAAWFTVSLNADAVSFETTAPAAEITLLESDGSARATLSANAPVWPTDPEGVTVADIYTDVQWDFEDGTIAPFIISGGTLNASMIADFSYDANLKVGASVSGKEIGKHGTYWLNTFFNTAQTQTAENGVITQRAVVSGTGAETYTGQLKSPVFVLNPQNTSITMQLGGNKANSVSVYDYATGEKVGAAVTAAGSWMMSTRSVVWNSGFTYTEGQKLYMQIEDSTTSSYGFVCVDNICFSGRVVANAYVANGVLTLNQYNGGKITVTAGGTLNIDLIGQNTLTSTSGDCVIHNNTKNNGDSIVITSSDENNSLTAVARSYAITSQAGHVIIEGCAKLTAYNTYNGADVLRAANSGSEKSGYVVIRENADVTLGAHDGLGVASWCPLRAQNTNGGVYIGDSATVTIYATTAGTNSGAAILADGCVGGITVTDHADVTVKSAYNGLWATAGNVAIVNGASVTVENAANCGILINGANQINISDAVVSIASASHGMYTNVTGGSICVADSTVSLSSSGGAGIYARSGLSITGSTTNLTVAHSTTALYNQTANVLLIDAATVNVTADALHGIQSGAGGMTIQNGARITAAANATNGAGLYTTGGLSITGSDTTVSLTAPGGVGIYNKSASAGIQITDATVRINADTYGIQDVAAAITVDGAALLDIAANQFDRLVSTGGTVSVAETASMNLSGGDSSKTVAWSDRDTFIPHASGAAAPAAFEIAGIQVRTDASKGPGLRFVARISQSVIEKIKAAAGAEENDAVTYGVLIQWKKYSDGHELTLTDVDGTGLSKGGVYNRTGEKLFKDYRTEEGDGYVYYTAVITGLGYGFTADGTGYLDAEFIARPYVTVNGVTYYATDNGGTYASGGYSYAGGYCMSLIKAANYIVENRMEGYNYVDRLYGEYMTAYFGE